jgi:hypothetical protein
MRYYYADAANQPIGPYELEELRRLHVAGVIRPDTLVAQEAGTSWRPYRDLMIPATPPPPDSPLLAATGSLAFASVPTAQPVSQDERTTATFLHLANFLGIASLGAGLVVPIVIWIYYKDRSWFVGRHGLTYVNKLLSYIVYGVVCGLLLFALIGYVLLAALIILDIVTTILAAMAANRGELYEYPLTIRILK